MMAIGPMQFLLTETIVADAGWVLSPPLVFVFDILSGIVINGGAL